MDLFEKITKISLQLQAGNLNLTKQSKNNYFLLCANLKMYGQNKDSVTF